MIKDEDLYTVHLTLREKRLLKEQLEMLFIDAKTSPNYGCWSSEEARKRYSLAVELYYHL